MEPADPINWEDKDMSTGEWSSQDQQSIGSEKKEGREKRKGGGD